ncbi:MAG: hypothetical protein AAGH68_07725, partial [Pseudomonadota bacterium]
MPIAYRIFTDIDLCYARWTGRVSFEEARANWERYLAEPDYRPGRPELIDHRWIDSFDITVPQIRTLVNQVNQQDFPDASGTLTVVLAQSPVAYGVARQYQSVADLLPGIKVEIYQDEAEALSALGRSERTVEEVLHGR